MLDFSLPASDPNNPNAYLTTPSERALLLAAALRQQQAGSDTSPIRSPWQGAARMAQALMGGLDQGMMQNDQNQGMASNRLGMGMALTGDTSNMDIPTGSNSPGLAAHDKSQDYNQDAPDNSAPGYNWGVPDTGQPPPPSSPSGSPTNPTSSAVPSDGGPIPQSYYDRTAKIEGGGNGAVSSTGAQGKYQFTKGTWAQYGGGGDINGDQEGAMQRLTLANNDSLTAALGRAPTQGELYLAHQQGAQGAIKLIQNPDTPAGQLVGNQAVRVNGGNPDAPASAFVNKWTGKFGGPAPTALAYAAPAAPAAPAYVPGYRDNLGSGAGGGVGSNSGAPAPLAYAAADPAPAPMPSTPAAPVGSPDSQYPSGVAGGLGPNYFNGGQPAMAAAPTAPAPTALNGPVLPATGNTPDSINAWNAAHGAVQPPAPATREGLAAAVNPSIAVPGYDGTFSRDQATDAEGAPSPAEWDAASKSAGQTAGPGAPSTPPSTPAPSPSPAPAPTAAPAPSVQPGQPDQTGANLQRQARMQDLMGVMMSAYATPTQQQYAKEQLAALSTNTQQMQTFKDDAGSVWQKNPATGEMKILQDNSKAEKSKWGIIGEDQYGGKQYGFVDPSTGKVTPYSGPGQPGQPGGAPTVDPNVHGAEFMSTLDPAIRPQVQGIIDGRIQYPTGMFLRTPQGQKIAQSVTQADPTFNASDVQARWKANNEFSTGGPNSPAGAITAGNTAILHLGELSDAGENLNNGQFPMLNSIENAFGTQTGGSKVTNFQNIADRFNEEATKFYRGIGGSEADIARGMINLNPNMSPDQMRQAIKLQAGLMKDKIGELQTRWHNVMGPNAPDRPITSPEAQSTLDKINQRAATGAPPSPGVAGPGVATGAPAGPGVAGPGVAAGAPQVGFQKGGYTFKGGNPADPASWGKN